MLAAAELNIDGAYLLGLLSRVLHTTCGATLLGGLVYLRFVLAPAVGDDPEGTLFAGRRKAWAGCVGACTGLLLLSGFYNFFFSVQWKYENLPALYHPLFGVKFLLALAVMAIMALVAGKTKLAEKVRAGLSGWLSIALACALAIFVLGAMLRSFRDLPDALEAPATDAAPAFGEAPLIETPAEPLPSETDGQEG